MKKIKILQFPIANSKGGLTTYVLENWKYIDKDRFQFDFATRSKKLDFEEELIEQGCKIHYLSCSSEENEALFRQEVSAILEQGYDVVHLHTLYWKGYLVEEIALNKKCPKIIIHSHNTMIDLADEAKRQEALLIHNKCKASLPRNYGTDFWACSKEAADWLFGDQIPKDKIVIMENAISLDQFSYSEGTRNQVRSELGLENKYVFGHVGRIDFQKNHEFLLNTFKRVSVEIPEARLVLVGDGPLREPVHKLVEELDLTEKVIFLGKRKDVSSLLQAFDCFVFPSRFEGLGIALVEAQAMGLPCLASNHVPVDSKVSDLIKFMPLDQELFVNALIKIYKNKEHFNRALEAKKGIDPRYNILNQIKRIEAEYEMKN